MVVRRMAHVPFYIGHMSYSDHVNEMFRGYFTKYGNEKRYTLQLLREKIFFYHLH
jgi:hypothetical protein